MMRWLMALVLAVSTVLGTGLAAESRGKAYLGITPGPVAEAGKSGVTVHDLAPEGPAEKAGLKNGDVILKIAGKEVKDARGLASIVGEHKPGDKVAIDVLRDGKEQTVEVTLGERAGFRQPQLGQLQLPAVQRGGRLGVHIQPVTPELKERLGLATDKGAIISEVIPNSPAAKAGLKVDDVIVGVGGKDVAGPEELRQAVRSAKPGDELSLKVIRGKEQMDIKARVEEGGEVAAGDMPDLQEFMKKFFQGRFGDGKFPEIQLPEGVPPFKFEGFQFDLQKMQDLEKRVQDLEKRLAEMEKRLNEKK